MNARTDLTELLDAYLADGADVLPDRVIEAALETIDRTDQRSPVRRPQRRQIVSQPLRFAAAAVIAVAVLGSLAFLTQSRRPPAASSPVGSPGASVVPSLVIGSPAAVPTSSPPAARPASWSAAGSMSSPRFLMTATLLADGRVLVAGGRTSADPQSLTLASAELYDPAAKRWTPIAPMSARRAGHTATLLADGRVLIVGGYDNFAALATAEIYDPVTGQWAATGSLHEARGFHVAVRLGDGRVLVSGGRSNDSSTGRALRSSELYDPATGRWSAAGDLLDGHYDHSATLLPDGRVVVAGASWTYKPKAIATGEIFDLSTGRWTPTAPMVESRYADLGFTLDDGRVLVVGSGTSADAEIYDPAVDRWVATRPMTSNRWYPTGALLPDGRIIVVGGEAGPGSRGGSTAFVAGSALRTAEVFELASGTWSATMTMETAREFARGVVLKDGSLLVIGGSNGGVGIASAERFDPGVAE
jgi:hypothetical protein